MAAATFDPITRESILGNLPELQKRRRRAKQLRKDQDKFRAMMEKDRELGGVAETQHGGLFQTVGSYIPNYGGMAEKLTGALGGYLTGKQAEGAEDDLNALRNRERIDSEAQMAMDETPEGGAANEVVQEYLDLMDEEESGKGGRAKPDQAQADQIDDDGNVWTRMKSGKWVKAGFKARYGMKPMTSKTTGDVYQVPTTSQGDVQQVMMPGSAPPAAPVPGAPGGPPSVTGLEGMNPQQQRELQTVVSSMQAMEMPQDVIDTYVAKAQAKAANPPVPGQTQGPMTTTAEGLNPDGTPVAPVPPGPPAPPPQPDVAAALNGSMGVPPPPAPPPQPLNMGGAAEVAAATERAKLQAQVDMAPQTAAAGAYAKGMETGAQVDATTAAEARAKLPTAKLHKQQLDKHITEMIAHPGMPDVIGKGILARVSKLEKVPGASWIPSAAEFAMSGTEAMGALARFRQLRGEVFLPAIQSLRGTGPVSNIEGDKAQAALGRMEQSTSIPEFKAALADFQQAYAAGVLAMEQTANGQNAAPIPGYTAPGAPPVAPPAARPALPAGFSWED